MLYFHFDPEFYSDEHELVVRAKEFDRSNRQFGGKRPLGGSALNILRFLVEYEHKYKTKKIPTYAQIQEATHCARDTINRALKALKEHGFIESIQNS